MKKARPIPKFTTRKTLTFEDELWNKISTFRFENKIATEVMAVRRLIYLGLDSVNRMRRDETKMEFEERYNAKSD